MREGRHHCQRENSFPALPRSFGGRRTAVCRAVMTDVVVRYSLTYLLLGKGCYVVEGDVS